MDHKPSSSFFTKVHLFSFILPLYLFLFLILILFQSFNIQFPTFNSNINQQTKHASNPCNGRYIYMYDLPTRFNSEILQDCKHFSHWFDMCPLIQNSGLGPKINNTGSVLPETGWYATNQWILEIIFHNRMMQYDCLTTNYSQSNAVFIPFYIGLDLMRYLFGDVRSRDILTNDLIQWLKGRPEWLEKGGKDHFLLAGRTVWDYLRPEEEAGWGSRFLLLPESKNMTLLLIESFKGLNNQFAIPYPTYFHPLKESEVISWQEKVRSTERKSLFSFVGGRRPPPFRNITSMRNLVIDQCDKANLCNLVDCGKQTDICNYSPSSVMSVFMSSKFCLQPFGDTPTRRSTFDSMLAGCIPVFFHPSSAYTQYVWYFSKNFNKFSVYIPEDALRKKRIIIQDVLLGYSEEQVIEMREEVIRMIPRLVYKDPRFKSENFRDAIDVAIDGVINAIEKTN